MKYLPCSCILALSLCRGFQRFIRIFFHQFIVCGDGIVEQVEQIILGDLKLRIAPRHGRFRNAPPIRIPDLFCSFFAKNLSMLMCGRSENVLKCSCKHGICGRFPRCFNQIIPYASFCNHTVPFAIHIDFRIGLFQFTVVSVFNSFLFRGV